MSSFNFAEWKIKLDMTNRYAVARSTCHEILETVKERFPLLKEFIITDIYDGNYVALDCSKLDSMDPFVFDDIHFPFVYENTVLDNDSWIIRYNGDIFLYDAINIIRGNVCSDQYYGPCNDTKTQLLADVKQTENRIFQYQNYPPSALNSGTYKQLYDDCTDHLIKLTRFLKIVSKELVYDETTQTFVKR